MANSRLQQEIKKKRPFESSRQEANLNVLKTTDLLQNRFGRFFREFGLTPSQYNVLRILREEGSPLPSLEVGARMIQVVPAMTGLIDRLEKQELVRRRRCKEDRRIVYIELTDSALTLLEEIAPPLLELHDRLSCELTAKEVKELTRLMEKMRSGIED
ncbi:MarR family winged helix-turn-helix transcriptional regulator [Thalassoglobus polymorphus]|uniref:HTH-type transcriptional regulator MhqR n=1 Tax=Thalassoglobus polymorphus TaxID=2527994 RepID=A0A517QIP3_9PLAN|nr:MarR family transcriptional regulator [Thalassoglobus polymorphus]QDT31523.1 HTH-type transcriptional regulator MhqR [Thalassoglobus polymorphus]